MSVSTTSTTEERAVTLLGQGIPPTVVANTLGVDVSRISQLLADDKFALQVVEKKFEALSKYNQQDNLADETEEKLLKKLNETLPFLTRPMEILKAYQVLNAAKRKGHTVPDNLTNQQRVIQLNIPKILIEKFQANIHNQVTQVGNQTLVTIQSGQMLKTLEKQNDTVLISSSGETS
jgi:hypothetical protein